MFRGRFFALGDADLKILRATRGDVARRALVSGWEESWPRERYQDTDKAWYFLSLMLGFSGPRGLLFRMGQQMHRGDSMIMNLIVRADVVRVSAALERVERPDLRRAYDRLSDREFYAGELKHSTAQFRYVMNWFERIRAFVSAHRDEHLLFTSDWA